MFIPPSALGLLPQRSPSMLFPSSVNGRLLFPVSQCSLARLVAGNILCCSGSATILGKCLSWVSRPRFLSDMILPHTQMQGDLSNGLYPKHIPVPSPASIGFFSPISQRHQGLLPFLRVLRPLHCEEVGREGAILCLSWSGSHLPPLCLPHQGGFSKLSTQSPIQAWENKK